MLPLVPERMLTAVESKVALAVSYMAVYRSIKRCSFFGSWRSARSSLDLIAFA